MFFASVFSDHSDSTCGMFKSVVTCVQLSASICDLIVCYKKCHRLQLNWFICCHSGVIEDRIQWLTAHVNITELSGLCAEWTNMPVLRHKGGWRPSCEGMIHAAYVHKCAGSSCLKRGNQWPSYWHAWEFLKETDGIFKVLFRENFAKIILMLAY